MGSPVSTLSSATIPCAPEMLPRIQSFNLKSDQRHAAVKLGDPRKPLFLSRGETILFTQDDYSVRPPKIRAGEIAQITSIDPDRNSS